MESSTKRTQRDYGLSFKLAVVEQVERGELSYREAQRRYGIQGRSTVLVWLRKHGLQDWERMRSGEARRAEMAVDRKVQETPEQRIKALEEQLKVANEKARLFEAMLDVIREDYGVKVTKKRLGKSSRASLSKA